MCMHIHVDAYKRAAPPLLRAPHTPPHHTATREPPSPLPGRRRRRRLSPTWTPSTRDRSRSCRHGHTVEHCAVLKCALRATCNLIMMDRAPGIWLSKQRAI